MFIHYYYYFIVNKANHEEKKDIIYLNNILTQRKLGRKNKNRGSE